MCLDFFNTPDLSVKCDTNTVYLNTSGIPPHNYLDPKHLVENQNFEIEFPLNPVLPDPNSIPSYQDPCDFTTVFHLDNKPSGEKYLPIVGFSLNGVPFFSPLSIDSVDPFYPPPSSSPEDLDGCMGHTQGTGIYHYHMMPPCLFGDDSAGHTPLQQVGDPATVALNGFDPTQGQILIGYAFDGFPIYGPYNDNGEFHTDLDNCNGKKDENDNYAYYSTITFPYHIGCFGPGIYDAPTPNCTTNPS